MGFVTDIKHALHAPCAEQAQLLSRHRDQSQTRGTRLGMWMHRLRCQGCAAYARHLARLHALCAALGKETLQPPPASQASREDVGQHAALPPALPAGARERIATTLTQAASPPIR